MLLQIRRRHLLPDLSQMLLHRGIHGQLLADRMSSERPSELIAPLHLVFMRLRVLELRAAQVHVLVVGADGFGDGLVGYVLVHFGSGVSFKMV